MRAVLFPGQGSQYVNMGLDFYEKFDSVKKNFDLVDKTLKFPLSEIILKGPESKLKLTENTQPAIMIVGVSIYNILNNNYDLKLNDSKFFAGHSLGEYTALVCAGSLSIEKASYLLRERGKAMQESTPAGEGAMVAVLGMQIEEVEKAAMIQVIDEPFIPWEHDSPKRGIILLITTFLSFFTGIILVYSKEFLFEMD